jgi:hypothetical protein
MDQHWILTKHNRPENLSTGRLSETNCIVSGWISPSQCEWNKRCERLSDALERVQRLMKAYRCPALFIRCIGLDRLSFSKSAIELLDQVKTILPSAVVAMFRWYVNLSRICTGYASRDFFRRGGGGASAARRPPRIYGIRSIGRVTCTFSKVIKKFEKCGRMSSAGGESWGRKTGHRPVKS